MAGKHDRIVILGAYDVISTRVQRVESVVRCSAL